MIPSSPINALFLDIGGVLLTNGWDNHIQKRAADKFGLDYDEMDDFTSIDETELELVMDRLNHRPRKCLGFMSALEKFFYHSIALQS